MWLSSGKQFLKGPIVDDVDRLVILGNPFDNVGTGLQVGMRMERWVARDLALMSECHKNQLGCAYFNIFRAGHNLDSFFTKALDGMGFEVSS